MPAQNDKMAPQGQQDETVTQGELETLKAEIARLKESRAASEKKAADAEASLEQLRKKAGKEAISAEERNKRLLKQQKKVFLTIHSGRGDMDKAHVPIGCGGREYLIERDKKVAVPEAVANILRLAVRLEAVSVADASGRQRTEFRKAQRFSFTIETYDPAQDPELIKTGE